MLWGSVFWDCGSQSKFTIAIAIVTPNPQATVA